MIPLRFAVAPALFVAAGIAACSRVPIVTYATRSALIPVEGMTCTGCEGTISSTVLGVEGVDACSASFEKAQVQVTYAVALTDETKIAEAIRSVGYTVPDKN